MGARPYYSLKYLSKWTSKGLICGLDSQQCKQTLFCHYLHQQKLVLKEVKSKTKKKNFECCKTFFGEKNGKKEKNEVS